MNRVLKIGIMYLVLIVLLEILPMFISNQVNLFFGQYIIILIPAIVIALLFKVDLKERLKLNKFKPKSIIYLFVIFMAMLPVSGFIGELTTFIFGENPNGIGTFIDNLTVSPLQQFFIIAITPAICEEVMFRGVLLDTKSGLNIHGLALLGGLMFGLFHIGYDQVFYTFVLGMVFTYAAVITGSIYPAMILHFFNNSFATLVGLLVKPEEAAEVVAVVGSDKAFELIGLIGWIPITIVGLLIVRAMFRKMTDLYGYSDYKRMKENTDDVLALESKQKWITYAPVIIMAIYVIAINILLR